VDELYHTLRRLAARGATVAVVSHRLDEVVRHCDRVSVMRRGRLVHAEALAARAGEAEPATEPPAQAEAELRTRLTRAIMGGEIPPEAHPPELAQAASPALRIEELDLERADARKLLDGVSLTVHRGEILGIAGVEGNGQRELCLVLAGLEAPTRGRVMLEGRVLFSAERRGSAAPGPAAVAEGRARGLLVVHEDRQRDELLLEATLWDNLVLGDLGSVDEPPTVRRRLNRFEVSPAEPTRLAAELSGGNQQKLVLARAMDRELRVLVLAQPTRGIDVGTARAIHHAIASTAARGVAVVLLSADLHELRSLSHRIVVLRRGRVAAELAPDATDEAIGRAMLGSEAA